MSDLSSRTLQLVDFFKNCPMAKEIKLVAYKHEPDALTIDLSDAELIVDLAKMVKDAEELKFHQLLDICGVDYLGQPTDARFAVVYHFLSIWHNLRLRVRVYVSGAAIVPSLSGVFLSAPWYEREVFDMYGLQFSGHPDLRRILTDYDFVGYPLRKDFPLSGYKEVRYSAIEGKVVEQDVELAQAYRNFDFNMPWGEMRARMAPIMDLPVDQAKEDSSK